MKQPPTLFVQSLSDTWQIETSFFSVLGVKLKVSCIVPTSPTIEVHPRPVTEILKDDLKNAFLSRSVIINFFSEKTNSLKSNLLPKILKLSRSSGNVISTTLLKHAFVFPSSKGFHCFG